MGRTIGPGRHAIHATRRGFSDKTIDYESDPYVAADLALTKQIAEVLERHYPCHPWMVEVSHAKGCAFISLPLIMKRNQKYVLHISSLKADPGMRSVMRAAGEVLERHNVPRVGFGLDAFLRARDSGPFGRRPPPKLALE